VDGHPGEEPTIKALADPQKPETGDFSSSTFADFSSSIYSARAFYLDPRTLKVGHVFFERAQDEPEEDGAQSVPASLAPAPKVRGDISGTGEKMIGQIRTCALHRALDAACATAEPWDLVGALLLAFCGDNIAVQGDATGGDGKLTARNAPLLPCFRKACW